VSAVDVTELLALAGELTAAGRTVTAQARAVVAKGAVNVKRDWRAGAAGTAGTHAPAYPASITYDLTTSRGAVEAVIGPDKGRPQGALGNLLEFGSANNPPHLDGLRALLAEQPRFVEAMSRIGFASP